MTDPRWVVIVRLSESFRSTLADISTQLGAGILEWTPKGGYVSISSDGGLLVILAGGSEGEALDLLTTLPSTPIPKFVIGSLPDHRLAAGAIQRGATDYFALPDDLDLLRRSLERELREARGKVAAQRFAADERRESGFEAIIGRSSSLRSSRLRRAWVAVHRDVTCADWRRNGVESNCCR